MSIALPKVDTVSPETTPFRALIYGKTGSGKTSLAVTANQHEALAPVYILNFDDGLSSVSHIPGIRQSRITSTAEAFAVTGELLKPNHLRDPQFRDVRTIIIDSISAWRDDVLIENVERSMQGKARDLIMPQRQDYGQMTYQITAILNGLSQADYHMIITAGQDEERSADGQMITAIKPLINPKLVETVGHMVGYIWYVWKKEDDYRLLTIERGAYQIKTRNPLFVRSIRQETRRRVGEKWAGNPDVTSKMDAGEGWWFLDMDDDGIVQPNIPYFYDMYLAATHKA